MFTIDAEARVTSLPQADGERSYDVPDALKFSTSRQLSDLIMAHSGEFAVQFWNQLPGVVPITTSKFRNRSTAVERIWSKLCELYPDAILPEDMPKAKARNVHQHRPKRKRGTRTHPAGSPEAPARKASRPGKHPNSPNGTARKSAWAEELTVELRKRFNPGESFTLEDVYKLIPVFQRKHKENNHIAARLRTTLAQDLRGRGVVKSLKARGAYQMVAA